MAPITSGSRLFQVELNPWAADAWDVGDWMWTIGPTGLAGAIAAAHVPPTFHRQMPAPIAAHCRGGTPPLL